MNSPVFKLMMLTLGVAFFSCTTKQPAPLQPDTLVSVKKDSIKEPDTLKHIYLTFDDGPLNGSEYIDSIALSEKLKINVFSVSHNMMLSQKMRSYFLMYQDNPYVDLYNHSFSHAHNKYKEYYSDPQNVLADIIRNEDTLHLHYKIVRLPGRNIWRVGNRSKDFFDSSGDASANLLATNGYQIYGWDIEWRHNAKTGKPLQSVSKMVHDVETRLQNGKTFTPGNIVVLLHDEMFRNPAEQQELKSFIDSLRLNKNYAFEHIRSYPISN